MPGAPGPKCPITALACRRLIHGEIAGCILHVWTVWPITVFFGFQSCPLSPTPHPPATCLCITPRPRLKDMRRLAGAAVKDDGRAAAQGIAELIGYISEIQVWSAASSDGMTYQLSKEGRNQLAADCRHVLHLLCTCNMSS